MSSVPSVVNNQTKKGFDYASLDAEISQFVQQQTGEVKALAQRTVQDIYEIGQKLLLVKQKLGHGCFLNWLDTEFGWSDRTAQRFMNVAEILKEKLQDKSVNLSNFNFDFTALYYVTAPSTPKQAREEVFARAIAGERITYTTAKTIRQEYAPSTSKPKLEPEPISQSPPAKTLVLPASGFKQEIVAIRPRERVLSVPQPLDSAPDVSGIWWQIGRHLLYCGEPNSFEFLERIPTDLKLLIALVPILGWQSRISAEVCIAIADRLPQCKNLDLLDEIVESNLLHHSHVGDWVVSCFLPSPKILVIINRLDRRGLLAEPDARRCNAIITDWKKAGLRVQRLI